MIELPEATTIARQITKELNGKSVESGNRGNSPHKFAFYNHTPEEYEAILKGKTVGAAVGQGSEIWIPLEPDYFLVLGDGGERILFHRDESTLPKKYQLLMQFVDGSYLTVTVQGWGFAQLLHKSEIEGKWGCNRGRKAVSPVSDEFTYEYFKGLFNELEKDDPRSIKFFIISKPGVWGVGNGYLQDILFRAKVHPRKRCVDLVDKEKKAIYEAIRETLKRAAELGGRDTEFDLYGNLGKYRKILDSKQADKPCPECGTPIEKQSYLGGAIYFCPSCQKLP